MSKRSRLGLIEREQVVALFRRRGLVLLCTGCRLSARGLVGAQTLDHSVLSLTINFLSRLLLGLRLLIGGVSVSWRSVFGFLLVLSRRILVFFLLVLGGTFALPRISLLVIRILFLGFIASVVLRRTAVATTSTAFPAFVVERMSVTAAAASLGLRPAPVLLVLLLLATFVLGTILTPAMTLALLSAALRLLLVVHRSLDSAGGNRGLFCCIYMLDPILVYLFMALSFESLALLDLARLFICVHHYPVRPCLWGRLLWNLGDLAGASVSELGRPSGARALLFELLE